ncbi:hypothetical protein EON64_16255 [archaeon]|nr:MAG: hypothetical protein EON64_16255 [archaeon]
MLCTSADTVSVLYYLHCLYPCLTPNRLPLAMAGISNGLCFEDGRGGLQVVRTAQLKDLLTAGGLLLDFVFVSACYSKEIGLAFVAAGVKHVVCVKVDSKIQDAAAIAFTRAFYVALLTGKSVKASFEIAQQALKASPYVPNSLLEGEKFILLPDQADHSPAVFQGRLTAHWPSAPSATCTVGRNRMDVAAHTYTYTYTHLPAPPADFEGREVCMYTCIRYIHERRCVSLVGEEGMGKSSVAAAVCRYLYDREVFRDHICYVRCKGVRDYGDFIRLLKGCVVSMHIPHVLGVLKAQAPGPADSQADIVYEEELVMQMLAPLRMLLVLDSLDDLLGDYSDHSTFVRLFLSRLHETCAHTKLLYVGVDTLSMRNITLGYSVIEYSVHLGPLTLHSALRLFARLTPSLETVHEKGAFIDALLPTRYVAQVQAHVPAGSASVVTQSHAGASGTAHSLGYVCVQILQLLGGGSPSRIVHLACESTPESVADLRDRGARLIKQGLGLGEAEGK